MPYTFREGITTRDLFPKFKDLRNQQTIRSKLSNPSWSEQHSSRFRSDGGAQQYQNLLPTDPDEDVEMGSMGGSGVGAVVIPVWVTVTDQTKDHITTIEKLSA